MHTHNDCTSFDVFNLFFIIFYQELLSILETKKFVQQIKSCDLNYMQKKNKTGNDIFERTFADPRDFLSRSFQVP